MSNKQRTQSIYKPIRLEIKFKNHTKKLKGMGEQSQKK